MSPENTHMHGDQVDGDKIDVGNIVNAKGVAIGQGASVNIQEGLTVEDVAILMVKLKNEDQPDVWDGRFPYLGLTAFQESDAQFFFGREGLVDELLERVKEARFIVIAGPSGSGKSSVARAGLFHALRDGGLDKSDGWLLATMQPKGNPIGQLAVAIDRMVGEPGKGDYVRENGRSNPLALHKQIDPLLSDDPRQRCVLLVDQFEETFTQTKEEDRAAFINLLTEAAKVENGRLTIILSLRADFISHCARYAELRKLMSQQFQLVGGMDPSDLAKAITLPALEVGANIDPELVSRIMTDMKGEPGALPLMSFALRDLFDAEKSIKGDPMDLTLSEYLNRGGIESALERHANEVFGTFTKEQKGLARGVFSKLIEVGQGRADTRRTAVFSELVPAGTTPEAVEAVVNALAEEGVRLITTGGEENGRTVTVAHEKLIDAWPWLRQLVDENREMIVLQNQINDDANSWDEKKDAGFLYRGGRLIQVEEQLEASSPDLNELSQAFIQASLDQRQKEIEEKQSAKAEKKRSTLFRRALIGGGVLILFLLVAIVVAVVQTNTARTYARISTARELAAAARSDLGVDPERSILLALYSVAATHDADETVVDEALEILHQALQESHIRQTLAGHTGPVSAVAFNTDGTKTATTSDDSTLKIWNSSTGDELMSLDHTGATLTVAFSPVEGSFIIATGSIDDVATIWDSSTGQKIFTLDTHTGSVWDVAFNADGTLLATASGDMTVKIWNVSTGKEVQSFSEHQGVVNGVDFSPDGTMIASAGEDNTVKLWDVSTGDAIYTYTEHAGVVEAVVFSPDGTSIATASHDGISTTRDGEIKIWDLVTHEEIRSFLGHTGEVYDVVFNANGTKLATVSADKTAIIWDVATGNDILTLGGHTNKVWGVAFSSDGELVATASRDKTAKIWNILVDGEKIAINGHDGIITSAEFSPDGKHVITAGQDGMMNVWDIASGQPLFNHSVPDAQIWGVAYQPNGTQMVTTSTDGTVTVRDAGSGQELFQLLEQQGGVLRVAYAADGTKIATTGIDGTVKIWNSVTGDAFKTLVGHIDDDGNGIPVQDVAFSPNGELVASVGNDGKVVLWELASGQQRHVFEQDGIAIRVAFTPDGTRLIASISGGDDSTEVVKVWNVESYEEMFTLSEHSGSIQGLAISPDGAWIATASRDGMVKLWDADTGLELFTISDSTVENWDVNFNSDSTQLLVARSDGTAVIYILDHDDLFALAESRITRSLTDDECRRLLRQDKCE